MEELRLMPSSEGLMDKGRREPQAVNTVKAKAGKQDSRLCSLRGSELVHADPGIRGWVGA